MVNGLTRRAGSLARGSLASAPHGPLHSRRATGFSLFPPSAQLSAVSFRICALPIFKVSNPRAPYTSRTGQDRTADHPERCARDDLCRTMALQREARPT